MFRYKLVKLCLVNTLRLHYCVQNLTVYTEKDEAYLWSASHAQHLANKSLCCQTHTNTIVHSLSSMWKYVHDNFLKREGVQKSLDRN